MQTGHFRGENLTKEELNKKQKLFKDESIPNSSLQLSLKIEAVSAPVF